MAAVIGLDIGTTNCKAIAFTPQMQVIAAASRDHKLYASSPGRAEQQPEEVWQGALQALTDLIAHFPAEQVSGICLSGAMHSLMPLDASGAPLAPALTWADERASSQAASLRTRVDSHALYLRTGCPLQPVYHPAKLRWWREQSGLGERAAGFASIKDWILFKLCGEWGIDFGLASSTGLLDIHRCIWDEEALQLAGVGPEMLPGLVAPVTIIGKLNRASAQATGLPGGLPVIVGSSDGALANLGAGAVGPGQAVITVGTSGAVRRWVAQPQLDALERTWCYLLDREHWFAGGAINNGGLALQWARQYLYPDLPGDAGYTQLLADVAGLPPGAGGLLALPYFTGERSPHWDASARALLWGLGLEHSRGHIARAILEGVAYCLQEVAEAVELHPGRKDVIVKLTGGITRSRTWAQILADVLGLPLLMAEAADASAAGAALIGHLALGQITSLEQAASCIAFDERLEPQPAAHDIYGPLHQRFQELYRNLKPRSI